MKIILRRIGAVASVFVVTSALAACAANGANSTSALSTSASSPPATTASTAPVTAPPASTPAATHTTPPPKTKAPTGPMLGPTGYGALTLGMSPDEAASTNLITTPGSPSPGCDTGSRLKGAPAGDNLSLFFSPTLGLVAIYAYGDIQTVDGIHLGSTLAAVRHAYPDWQGLEGNSGRGHAKAGPNSNYRIVITNGKVVELDVQLNNQDCYE